MSGGAHLPGSAPGQHSLEVRGDIVAMAIESLAKLYPI